MNIPRAQRRVIFFVILPALLLYVGLRFYAQYRHVDVYVLRAAPLPPELAKALSPEAGAKLLQFTGIETPYDKAPDKMVPPEEIARLRAAIAWSKAMPPFIDTLSIQSPTQALARRITGRVMLEYQLVKHDGRWRVESVERSAVVQ